MQKSGLLLACLFISLSSALLIDDMLSGPSIQMTSAGSQSVSASSGVLGFERDVIVIGGVQDVRIPYLSFGSNYRGYMTYPNSAIGAVTIQYDGADGSSDIANPGLAADLTEGGTKDQFVVTAGTSRVAAGADNYYFKITTYTSSGTACIFSDVQVPYNQNGPTDVKVPFDQSGCPASSFTAVRGIEIKFVFQVAANNGAMSIQFKRFETKGPVNDDWSKAIEVTVPSTVTLNTADANNVKNPLSDFPEFKDATTLMWYKIAPANTHLVINLDSCGSTTDTVLFVYTAPTQVEFNYFEYDTYRIYQLNDERNDLNTNCNSLTSLIRDFSIDVDDYVYIVVATAPGSTPGAATLDISYSDYSEDFQAIVNSAQQSIEASVELVLEDTSNILTQGASILDDTADIISDTAQIIANTTALTTTTNNIQTDTTQIRADTAQIRTDAGQIKTTTNGIQSDTTAIRADTTSILADTTALKGTAGSILTNTNTIITDTTTIKGDTAAIRPDVASIKSTTTQIQADTTDIKAATTSIIADTTSLKSSATTITAGVTQLLDDTTDILTDSTTLKGTTTSILADTTSIKATLATISNLVSEIVASKAKDYLTASSVANVPVDALTPALYGGSLDQIYTLVNSNFLAQSALATTNPTFASWWGTTVANASKATKGLQAYNYNINQYNNSVSIQDYRNAFLFLQKAYKALYPVPW